MKKRFKKLVAALLAVTSLLAVGCEKESEDNGGMVNSTVVVSESNTSNRCISKMAEEMQYTSYKKEGLYYYIFNVGYIECVPLQENANYHRYSGTTEDTVTLSSSKSSSNEISNIVQEVETKSGEWHVGGSAEASYGPLKAGFEWGVSKQWNNTTTKTVEEVSKFTEEQSESIQYTWKPDISKPGYYRYVLEGTVTIFACIVYDPVKKQEIYSTSYSLVNESYWALEYSETPVFKNNEIEKLKLCDEYKNIIGIEPEIEYEGYLVDNVNVLNKTNSITITQDGAYGLGQKNYDTLYLSEYEKYFTDEYVFCFDVTINISEKDDGRQELYLYNRIDKSTTATVKYVVAQNDYGMVCGSTILHSGGSAAADHKIYWYVKGNEVRNAMYIRYDASGNNADTWYRRGIKVLLSISKASTEVADNGKIVLNDSTEKAVYDSGGYGLHPKQSYDEIDLSKYSDYMGNGYLFVFDFSVNLREKDDGYQEVYLYNNNGTSSKIETVKNAINNYGLVSGKVIEHERGKKLTDSRKYDFTFYVNGLNIRENMFVRYDAFGDDGDTWYRENIKVTLRIFKVPDCEIDNSVANAYETY